MCWPLNLIIQIPLIYYLPIICCITVFLDRNLKLVYFINCTKFIIFMMKNHNEYH